MSFLFACMGSRELEAPFAVLPHEDKGKMGGVHVLKIQPLLLQHTKNPLLSRFSTL